MMNEKYNITHQEVILFKALLLASEKLDIPDCEDYLFRIISKKKNISIDDVRAYGELLIKMFSLYVPSEKRQDENIKKYGGKLKTLLDKYYFNKSIKNIKQKAKYNIGTAFFTEFKNKAKNVYQDKGFRDEQYGKITSENKEIMNKMMEQRKQEFGTSWEKSPLWWKIVSGIFTFGIRPLCNLKAPLCCCCEDSVQVIE